ncbi:hypothetical protein SDC9_60435 [bioreactor metagenome]|uniref:Uncharacterized protein n=1 Tax=bioreactor metagenome TaxID=1076179 RepID=A0A644XD00_9ZZZZ
MQLRPDQTLHGDEAMQSMSYPPLPESIAKTELHVITICSCPGYVQHPKEP